MLKRFNLLAIGCVLLSPQAFSEQAADEEIEEVVVTGSYFKGLPGDAPSPVETITRASLVTSGVSDLAEFTRNLSIASGSDTAAQNETRFNGNSGAGLANINLRGVGPTATLVLLDGKRLPYAGQKLADGDRFVDINSIPITMIQRVEVLKDGGSAIYGSDAIAGVVNFITRSDFEGFEIDLKYQETSKGSQDDATLGAIWGWASDDDNSHFVIGGEYFDRGHLLSKDRTDLTRDVYARQNDTIVSSFPFSGPDAQCGTTGRGFFVNDGFDSEPSNCNRSGSDTEVFIPEAERASILATFSHSFSDAAEVYGQASWIETASGESRPVHVGPIEPKYGLPTIFNIATGGFGLGSFVANDPSRAGVEFYDYELRTPGIDADRNYDASSEQETTRFQVGIRGEFEIGDKPWNYDLSIVRGDSEFKTQYLGLDKDRLELAHYGLGGPNCTANGNLTDPTARFLLAGADGAFDLGAAGGVGPLESTLVSLMGNLPGLPFINPDNVLLAMTSTNRGDNADGCYFFNPYLSKGEPGSENSEELLRWLEVEVDSAQKSETYVTTVDFVMAGELFDLDAGPVSLAIGMQYREEGRDTTVNPQITGSVNSFGQLSGGESVAGLSENAGFDAERDIYAAFFEFQIPVTEDIDVQFAARYEDYGSDIGSTFDPKLGIRWQATPSLVLRGSASSSFRGPGLAQIEEGSGFSLEFGVTDVLAAGTNSAGRNCVRTGRCAIPGADAAPSVTIVKRGLATPDLKPESATTFNVGGIWEPVDGVLEGLTVGMDYYLIKFEDKIIDVPTQSLLGEELILFQAALAANDFVVAVPGVAGFGQACDPTDAIYDPGAAASEACQVNPASYAVNAANSSFIGGAITRRVDATQDLQIISSGALNTGKVETDGLDFNFSYTWDSDLGTWIVDGRFSKIFKFEVKDFPGGQPDFDAAGFTNNDPTRRLTQSMPDLKGNLGISWFREKHAARINTRFIGGYEDNGSANTIIGDGKLDDYYAVDFNYSYTMDVSDSALVLSIGAIDLFDASVPELKNSNGTDLQVFDPRGRRVYASVSFSL